MNGSNIAALYAAGNSIPDISRKNGMPRSAVGDYLRRAEEAARKEAN